ncbi:MAG: SpoVA/SpoVAEb family sporulation membrane protein [Clostridia bacterium]|nr:SpoVA/SpoVAEb family sporulation membrane protein [Clostridia bacterium]
MFDFLMYLKVFLIGGTICMLGQILVITTKMTSARILVTFLLLGVILECVGAFEPMKEFAGSGVTVPIMGFGYTLAKGAIIAGEQEGLLGVFVGGLKAAAGGIAVAVTMAFLVSLFFSSKTKK